MFWHDLYTVDRLASHVPSHTPGLTHDIAMGLITSKTREYALHMAYYGLSLVCPKKEPLDDIVWLGRWKNSFSLPC